MSERLTEREWQILSGYANGTVPRPSREAVKRMCEDYTVLRTRVEQAETRAEQLVEDKNYFRDRIPILEEELWKRLDIIRRLEAERDALRARAEAMERVVEAAMKLCELRGDVTPGDRQPLVDALAALGRTEEK